MFYRDFTEKMPPIFLTIRFSMDVKPWLSIVALRLKVSTWIYLESSSRSQLFLWDHCLTKKPERIETVVSGSCVKIFKWLVEPKQSLVVFVGFQAVA